VRCSKFSSFLHLCVCGRREDGLNLDDKLDLVEDLLLLRAAIFIPFTSTTSDITRTL
jgi:hypothetical protein